MSAPPSYTIELSRWDVARFTAAAGWRVVRDMPTAWLRFRALVMLVDVVASSFVRAWTTVLGAWVALASSVVAALVLDALAVEPGPRSACFFGAATIGIAWLVDVLLRVLKEPLR